LPFVGSPEKDKKSFDLVGGIEIRAVQSNLKRVILLIIIDMNMLATLLALLTVLSHQAVEVESKAGYRRGHSVK
jgi:hypothetical protein